MESLEDLRRENMQAVSDWLYKRDTIVVQETMGDIVNDYLPMNGGILIIVNREGIITYCNHYFSDMVGVAYTEVKGKPFSKFLHPDDVERTQHTYSVREEGVREEIFCNRYVCPKNESGWQWIAWPPNSDEFREQMVAIGYKIEGPNDPFVSRLGRFADEHWDRNQGK